MFDDFLKKSAELIERGEPFATATVVRCQAPSSGKPGDKAIIYPNGEIWGWIGGGCAQPVVIKEALKSLADRRPRLVRISPSADGSEEGIVDYTMTCHSGGALDIYLEPVLPNPHLVILGRSPVAQTLARVGRDIGYAVSVVSAEELKPEYFADAELVQDKDFNLSQAKITPKSFVVVSTQGEGDEEALEQALNSDASYLAFVASKTKAGKVFEYLRGRGISQARLDQVHAPAGLNIGAGAPPEIALSILAEIVKLRNSTETTAPLRTPPLRSAALTILNKEATDPICGMTVDTAKARHKMQFQGQWFYFCCAGCKDTFENAPEKYTRA